VFSQTPKSEEVRIGFIAPLSGEAATYGISARRGFDLALKDLNYSILGRNVRVFYEDGRCTGKEAVTGAQKLISVNKVILIIGELCSSATLAIAPLAEQNKVLLISPASTSPEITKAGDYIFRTVPSDALQGEFGAKLVERLGFKKLAILHSNEDYGIGFRNVLKNSFESLGREVVAIESFERGANDMKTQLTKIKEKQPDSIYIISNDPKAATIALKQIKELGISAQLFGSEGLKSKDIIEGAGGAAEGLILSSVTSGTPEFVEKFMEEYGEEPGPFSAQAYDALMAFSKALEKIGFFDREKVKNALYDIEFQGYSGHIDFDENGDVSGNYEVFKVINNEFVSQ
jgi:branched-chain amino acid transport system substrate-binding protein